MGGMEALNADSNGSGELALRLADEICSSCRLPQDQVDARLSITLPGAFLEEGAIVFESAKYFAGQSHPLAKVAEAPGPVPSAKDLRPPGPPPSYPRGPFV